MKCAPEFVKSPYWDRLTDTVKPGTPPDIKDALEKAFREYLAEGKRETESRIAVEEAAFDAPPYVIAAMKKAWEECIAKGKPKTDANFAAVQAAIDASREKKKRDEKKFAEKP